MRTECPCGRPGTFGGVLPYDRCCGRYLDDAGAPAPDAVSLMRSRYTAYATGRTDYLLATWDPATRPRELDPDPDLRWEGLKILDHLGAAPDAGGEPRAEVEFVARFRHSGGRSGGRSGGAGRPGEVRERSRFVRRAGRWFYLDGEVR